VAEAEKEKRALAKYFYRTTSEDEEKALEELHHSEDGNNLDMEPDYLMPGNQTGSLCTRSEISHFESVESARKGSSSDSASDESYEYENSNNLTEPLEEQTILLLGQVI